MAQFPQLPLWTDSYLADTTHLTTQEHGAYLLLLMAAWRSPGCRLPNDDKLLRRFAGGPKNWRRIKTRVLAFWLLNDGYLTQKRLCQEYERAANRAQKAALGGSSKSLKYNNATLFRAGSKQAPSTATTTTTIKNINNSSKEETARAKALVHVKRDSNQWKACAARFKRERGKNPPQDDRFGWHFPTDWPETKNTKEG